MWEWEFIGDNEPPPPPTSEAEFIEDVTQILTESGTGGTLSTADLELLSPDEWEGFVLGLLGFMSGGEPRGDQNSNYDDRYANTSPLGEFFLLDFGWMPSVQNLPGYHYYDYLIDDLDPELIEATLRTHELQEGFSSSGVSLEEIEGLKLTMLLNGTPVTFTWHSGAAPSAGGTSDPNEIVVTASSGYWICNFQPPGPDTDSWTDAPLATDFMQSTAANWAFAAQVNEALQYLVDSPTALALMRAARQNGVTIVLDTTQESHTVGSIVFWNPTAGLMINGLLQSPAMSLLHELAHALNWALRIPWVPDPQYDNSEERRVIVEIETVVARELGEPIRTSHSGSEVQVVFGVGITQHSPQPPG